VKANARAGPPGSVQSPRQGGSARAGARPMHRHGLARRCGPRAATVGQAWLAATPSASVTRPSRR
jgi:hypothetical protein